MALVTRLFLHNFLLASLIFASSHNIASAQAVGSHVECSPTSMPTSWWPGTVIKVDAAGNCTVRVDQRDGYAPSEEYFVSKNGCELLLRRVAMPCTLIAMVLLLWLDKSGSKLVLGHQG